MLCAAGVISREARCGQLGRWILLVPKVALLCRQLHSFTYNSAAVGHLQQQRHVIMVLDNSCPCGLCTSMCLWLMKVLLHKSFKVRPQHQQRFGLLHLPRCPDTTHMLSRRTMSRVAPAMGPHQRLRRQTAALGRLLRRNRHEELYHAYETSVSAHVGVISTAVGAHTRAMLCTRRPT